MESELDKVEKKKIKAIVFTTNGLKIEGNVFVPAGLRLIDAFNAAHNIFFVVEDAKIYISHKDAEPLYQQIVLVLNKNEIICASPLD